MANNGNGWTNYTGIGFFGALGLLFIGLRLTGCIDWPWWLVLMPIWGGFALGVLVIVIYFVFLAWVEGRRHP